MDEFTFKSDADLHEWQLPRVEWRCREHCTTSKEPGKCYCKRRLEPAVPAGITFISVEALMSMYDERVDREKARVRR